MTIEQERDIAVRALERIARYPQRRDSELGYTGCRSVATHALGEIQRAQALQALVDQAQELDMGYLSEDLNKAIDRAIAANTKEAP